MTHEADIKRLIEQTDNTERKYEACVLAVCALVGGLIVAFGVIGYLIKGVAS